MVTKKDITCKKCGAQATGDITYCPHCGELLPGKGEKRVIDESLIHDKWEHGDEKFYEERELWARDDGPVFSVYSERIVCRLYAQNRLLPYLKHKMLSKIDSNEEKASIKIAISIGVISVMSSLALGLEKYLSLHFLYVPGIVMLVLSCLLFFAGGIVSTICDAEEFCDYGISFSMNKMLNNWRKNVGWWKYIQETTTASFWFLISLVIGEFAIILFFVLKYLL